ncbi:MAG: glutamine--fructose-6-phosphate transaminase (isomerizing), partial [Candidatus Eisenbacteria bacterium]|nr:glutamine--fructose-6-phosphate transaminase (isomerizing) [Candidatus Eisenbacteria bacterium]
MCGIVGYTGPKACVPILIEGLRRLEYRGYDSAGIAVIEDKTVAVRKDKGKLAALESLLNGSAPQGKVGIAHTRWATHGSPTQANAHPHVDQSRRFAVVHNGIIENCDSLRASLVAKGHRFDTETDTEVLAHLIGEYWDGNLEQAVASALRLVEGAYGIAVVCDYEPEKIVGARKGSPLVVGVGDGEYFVASDVAAILSHTNQVIYLGDEEIVIITPRGYRTMTLDEVPIDKQIEEITWELTQAEKGGFAHFMLKEIFEQPRCIQNAIRGRLVDGTWEAHLGGLNLTEDELRAFQRIVFLACGTSWHAAMLGEYMIEEYCRIPVEVEYASEFRYRNPVIDSKTLVIVISQSGETADTLAAMREAQRRGATALGVCNVVGSTIAREADGGIYIHAGPEIGVAITLLPALLGLVGTRIDRLRVPGVQLRYESDHHTSRSTSARWARLVTRRPWPFLAAGSVLLVALAIPAARLELGWPDAGNLPPETTARHAYDLLAEGFGEGFNGPLLIAVDLREVADPTGALATISTAVAATPGVQ